MRLAIIRVRMIFIMWAYLLFIFLMFWLGMHVTSFAVEGREDEIIK